MLQTFFARVGWVIRLTPKCVTAKSQVSHQMGVKICEAPKRHTRVSFPIVPAKRDTGGSAGRLFVFKHGLLFLSKLNA
jgi:hypothetical protein